MQINKGRDVDVTVYKSLVLYIHPRCQPKARNNVEIQRKNVSAMNGGFPTNSLIEAVPVLFSLFIHLLTIPSLTLSYATIQDLMPKRDQILSLIHDSDPDVLALTETWLQPEINTSESFYTDTYNVYRPDHADKRGGGVLLTIRKTKPSCSIDSNSGLKIFLAACQPPPPPWSKINRCVLQSTGLFQFVHTTTSQQYYYCCKAV